MTTPHLQDESLSPLDQIRLAEAELNRKIVAARLSARAVLAEAREKAKSLTDEARQAGQREGRARYQETLLNAEEEARSMLAEARSQAARLRETGEAKLEMAVQQAVEFVTSLEREQRES
jgi:vacuolar-type H+-ATPase subunit H